MKQVEPKGERRTLMAKGSAIFHEMTYQGKIEFTEWPVECASIRLSIDKRAMLTREEGEKLGS